jgi:hypothetical protein
MAALVEDLVILSWGAAKSAAHNLQKIAAFLGVDAAMVALGSPAAGGASRTELFPRCRCLITDAESLAAAADAMGAAALFGLTTDAAQHVLVYGFEPSERHNAVLGVLSSGALRAVNGHADPDAEFHISADYREWCGQFSGLSLRAPASSSEHPFIDATDQRHETLIRQGDAPFFVGSRRGGSHLFFLGCGKPVDLDESAQHQAQPLSWFPRLIPLIMFLRGALRDRVWTAERPRACFIIDDPLLKSRYGFLDYERLIESMRRRRFSTSIAFIPWNYWRSSRATAALFSAADHAPGLCIHGCDHIQAEFETADGETLRGKARTALERMDAHRRLTGVPFDDVMVFPRGRFSPEAVAGLKAAGYLAAVNGDVCPAMVPRAATVRDLLQVAVTRFSDFPLFGRRYPRNVAEFAFDLFMGKPALVAEHHGYFRDGYGAIESFAEQLNALDDRLEWASLGAICSRACLIRPGRCGETMVRFYTNRFTLQNHASEARAYVLSRRQPSHQRSTTISVNGQLYPFERVGNDVQIRLALDVGQAANITVAQENADCVAAAWKASSLHNAKVLARRRFGEFRDNYIDTARAFLSRYRSTARTRVSERRQVAVGASAAGSQPSASPLIER